MPLTVAQMRTPVTRATAINTALNFLGAFGFNTGSWHTGSKQLAFVRLFAGAWADFSHTVKFTAELVYNELATGNALTEFSRSHYDNERDPAVRTRGTLRLTDAAGTGPHVLSASQLVASDIVNTPGFTFRNLGGGTIPLNGFVDLSFEAEVAGKSRNVAINTITKLETPIAGVTVNNPAISGSQTWITTFGADEEPDATLRTRNRTKWGTLNPLAIPGDGYINIALSVDGVAHVALDDQNPDGPGSLRVYIASSSGIATGPQITAVQNELNAKKPPTARPLALAASPTPVTFVGRIYVRGALNTAQKQADIKSALLAFINETPIGGSSVAGQIPKSEIIGFITAIAGVEKVELDTPAADVGVGMFNKAITDTAASMAGLSFPSV